jgi:DNA topoisomerase II
MAKTVEETYQKKTPKEHILLRPDTYIGSVDHDTQTMYVWCQEDRKIRQKNISYAPGLYKIFDEILVNAADNKIRDPKMNTLKVEISKEDNTISVYNNGKGIPIEIHSKEQVYVPELIFGHLLTSSNYDDNEKKVTGGRNGYGAKLCNIFSTEFTVETADRNVSKKYFQKFSKNMSITETPQIERYKGEDFTKITFKPDLKRFKMQELDDDIISLMKKRVYDMAGTVKNVVVYLNDEKIEIKSFTDYVKLYIDDNEQIVHQIVSDRWELAFVTSEDQFSQVSFVNSISTSKGGTHVNHVCDQLIEPIQEAIKKKEKKLDIKPIHIKNSMFLFINCLIENPSFDSQTKENLTLKMSSFGSKCQPIDSFVKNIIKNTTLIDRIVSFSKAKESAQLKKTDGTKSSRLSGLPKLEDANLAGTKRSAECTLILTEGDSAKTLAVAGLSVVGRDLYGVFPLKGKLLNVREANHKQIMENSEISNIKKILGLQHGKVYEDLSSLRYGHIMIMTDQDHDGSHIKGLIINFLDHFFPSLLRIKGFLQEFITPIVRATKGKVTKDFFTLPEYEIFKETNKDWHIKYYKGLGTSDSKDAKNYFSNLPLHVKNFEPVTENDRGLIDLAFNKKKADTRKAWLADFVPGTYLDQSVTNISITDFVNRELILFSMADNIRSIPSVVDGLKPGQRKVLYSCFLKNLKSEIKVAQLAGYVSEKSAYHHGEASLTMTIVNLAQDFVGSNNINLLEPIGQFGSRLQGGKDAASPRYIFTNLNPLTRLIFPELDDPVLNYLKDDNLDIEPEYYVPIIPMVLVNGADGIGTGWSTNIPNFNPIDIIRNLRKLMDNEEMEEMLPYYRNFRGEISNAADNKITVSGICNRLDDDVIQITELQIGMWTQNYKEYLESLLQSGTIKDYREYHTEKTVDFVVSSLNDFPLKLSTTLPLSNMVCFDSRGLIKRYSTVLEIIKDFYDVRLEYYIKRREARLVYLKDELIKYENKVRFITDIIEGSLVINNKPKDFVIEALTKKGYVQFSNSYDYLLNMLISSLTLERIKKLQNELAAAKMEYEKLLNTTPIDLWRYDLSVFEKSYTELVAKETAEYDLELSKKVKNVKFVKKSTGSSKISAAKIDAESVSQKPAKKTTKKSSEVTKKDSKKTAKKPLDESKKTSKKSLEVTKKDSKKTANKSVEATKRGSKKIANVQLPKKTSKANDSNSKKAKKNDDSLITSSDDSEEKPWDKYKK